MHRKLETQFEERGKAMFQLKRRLEQINSFQTHNSLSTGNSIQVNSAEMLEGAGVGADQEVELDEDGICDGKSSAGNRRLRARFGRRRSHNEELCVGSCGVILGRATFFGSEAPNGIRVSFIPCRTLLMLPNCTLDILDETLSYQEITSWRHLAR